MPLKSKRAVIRHSTYTAPSTCVVTARYPSITSLAPTLNYPPVQQPPLNPPPAGSAHLPIRIPDEHRWVHLRLLPTARIAVTNTQLVSNHKFDNIHSNLQKSSLAEPMPPQNTVSHQKNYAEKKDPYPLHRIALAPFQSVSELNRLLRELPLKIKRIGEDRFLSFLIDNSLAPMWSDVVDNLGSGNILSRQFSASLKREQFNAVAFYLLQRDALTELDRIFDGAGIPYAVFKGAHVRELLYEVPGKRPSIDIDVLVRKEDRVGAISALRKARFAFHPVAENISHEATLLKGRISIDLHWEIMRPDRTRVDLTNGMIGGSTMCKGFRVLSDTDCLLVLLVHPVFTKYLTTPAAELVRLVDLHRWIGIRKIDWDTVIDLAREAQVRTATWMTLSWLQLMIPSRVPETVNRRLAPGPIRRNYLSKWIREDNSTRLIDHPSLIKAGFTIPAHDRPSGALRFLWSLLREKRRAESITRKLEQITVPNNSRSD